MDISNISNIISFLSPIHLSSPFKLEIIPIVFFLVIWFLFARTVFQVYKKAKPENWEDNWYGGNKRNNAKKLDAEHGSVMEISEAVATPSEKLADIMPGMILIIGLLGTFLGLGLALDSASAILSGANTATNMDASMGELMKMLEGLGTKFKTSTWGLLAFILLKVILSKNGYEERRLRWSIEKVKSELDVVRDHKLQEDRANNQKIIDCMQTIASQFEQVTVSNQAAQRDQLHMLSMHGENTIAAIHINNEKQLHLLDIIRNNHSDSLNEIKEQSNAVGNEIKVLSITLANVLKEQSIAVRNELKAQSAEVGNEIRRQSGSVEKLLGKLADNSDDLIKIIELQHTDNKQLLEDNVQQSKQTRNAMVGFIEKNEATVTTLGKSAAGMSQAASTMGSSANHLQNVITTFRDNMEEVVSLMKKDLNSTISGMNASFGQNMTKMSGNLKSSIEDMSSSFKKNMSEMSQGLGNATRDISNAVNSLSANVDNTMKAVAATTKDSMDLQQKSQLQFTTTATALKQEILAMTNLVQELTQGINDQFGAVTEGIKRVEHTGKKIEALTNTVDGVFKDSLKEIKEIAVLAPSFDKLTSTVDEQKAILLVIADNTSKISPRKTGKQNNNTKPIAAIESRLFGRK
jgi:archaellum component FlaC